MIHYSLVCDADHAFEGWFRSSADFDRQAAANLVACPTCGSAQVTRGLMAPNVQASRTKEARAEAAAAARAAATPAAETQPAAAPEPARQPLMVANPAQKAMLEALRDLRSKVIENADYVGGRFAEEARKIHYGESEHRGIYGEATPEETKALIDEGIEIHPLPVIPDDRN